MDDVTKDTKEARALLETSGIHPIAMLVTCVAALGWQVAIRDGEEDVEGMIIGTREYMAKHRSKDTTTFTPPPPNIN